MMQPSLKGKKPNNVDTKFKARLIQPNPISGTDRSTQQIDPMIDPIDRIAYDLTHRNAIEI